VAETHLVKLQCLQNKVLSTTGKFPSSTSVRDIHIDFQIPYVYDFTQNYAGNKQKSFKMVKMKIFAILDKKPHTDNIKLKLGGGHVYNLSSALYCHELLLVEHKLLH
jgi:hypothetical protein